MKVIDGEINRGGNIKKIDIGCEIYGISFMIYIYDSSLSKNGLICRYNFKPNWEQGKFILTEVSKEDYVNIQEDFFTEGEVLTFVLEEED